MMPQDALSELAAIIAQRKSAAAETSYTAKLLAKGRAACAKKFGEEAVELALASVGQDKSHVIAEAADVLYHLLVVLAANDVELADVYAELERRRRMSGLAEKAARGETS
jgi:phosphoribosyl-ATP pyrophosphohydrolase